MITAQGLKKGPVFRKYVMIDKNFIGIIMDDEKPSPSSWTNDVYLENVWLRYDEERNNLEITGDELVSVCQGEKIRLTEEEAKLVEDDFVKIKVRRSGKVIRTVFGTMWIKERRPYRKLIHGSWVIKEMY